MSISILEIILALGGTSFVTTVLTLQIQRRKGKAEAGQEEGKEKQEHLNAQKITDEVYALMSGRLKEQFTEMENEIDVLKENQKQLLVTVKIQRENIEKLQQEVTDYKATCDTCQFRQEKIILKKTK